MTTVDMMAVINGHIMLALTLSLCVLLRVAHNLFFHKLRQFPGPLSGRASCLPKVYHILNGTIHYHVAEMHRRYGPVVRIAPNELSFTDTLAMRDIYTRKEGGKQELPMSPEFYNVIPQDAKPLQSETRARHDEVRKLLSSGFSNGARKLQEPIIQHYVSVLIQRLGEISVTEDGSSVAVNLCDWFSYFTFDVIGNLVFGTDFQCLMHSAYHPWVTLVKGSAKDLVKLQVLKTLGMFPVAHLVMRRLKLGARAYNTHVDLITSKTKQRIDLGTDRGDLVDELIKSDMGFEEIKENLSFLILAGSDTISSFLNCTIFLLTTHCHVLEKLATEIRQEFQEEDSITIKRVSCLPYLQAVVKESLRCYPPSALAAPRIAPSDGAEISGYHIPKGTVVGVWHWAQYRNPQLFADPHCFDPLRFMRPCIGKYANDRLDVVKPFLVGPRDCIGQKLANAEMRLVLARLIWKFDLRISDDSRNCLEQQKNYIFWAKPDLRVYLRPVRR